MAPTPEHLREILRRVQAGQHLGGGDVPAPTLAADVEMLLVLRLIEPGGATPYRLTAIGAQVLEALSRRPAS